MTCSSKCQEHGERDLSGVVTSCHLANSPEAFLGYKVTVGCSGLRSAFVESVW